MNANSTMYSRVLGGAIAVGLLALVSWGVVLSQDFEPGLLSTGQLATEQLISDRDFTLSADPAVEVLTVSFAGGMSGTVTAHRVFADGRFLVQVINPVDSEVVRQSETLISHDELNALVGIAIHGGLIEHDQRQFDSELRMYHSSDGGTIFFEMNIDRYRGPDQVNWAPASCSVSFRGVYSAARRFSDVDAFQALASIAREMNRYRDLAEATDEK